MKQFIEWLIEVLKLFVEDEAPADSVEKIPAVDMSSEYVRMFRVAKISKSKGWVRKVAREIWADQSKYKGVADHVGCPWWVPAMIHVMESNRSWSKNLHNGEPWDQKTTLVPKGRGPFSSWDEAAIDALMYDDVNKVKQWTLDTALKFFEEYNGLGYKRRGLASPYLWSFTNQYTKGKFVSDGKFDRNAVSKQVGICAYLLAFIELGYEIPGVTDVFDNEPPKKPVDDKDPSPKKDIRMAMWKMAEGEIGIKEYRGRRHHPRIIEYHSTTGGFGDDETPWCSSFCNWVAIQCGVKGTNSAAARSWLKWGKSTSRPKKGDIVVLWRGSRNGWQGHVGFYEGEERGMIYILGGNQNNAVSIKPYSRSRLLGFRTLA